MVGAPASLDPGVEVRLVDDRAGVVTAVVVGADLAALFAYSRAWSADVQREGVDLSFSSMLAAMVGDDQPLCRWLVGSDQQISTTLLQHDPKSSLWGALLLNRNHPQRWPDGSKRGFRTKALAGRGTRNRRTAAAPRF